MMHKQVDISKDTGNITKWVIIAGWHHDSNKGDGVILRALITALQENHNCKIGLYSCISPFESSWRSILKYDMPVKTNLDLLAPLIYIRKFNSYLLKMMWAGYVFLRFILLLISPKIASNFLNEWEKRTLDTFLRCDIVLGKGGHYIYDLGGLSGFFSLCVNLAPFLLAARLRKPYVFIGISVGPFSNPISKLVAKYVFRRAVAISVREHSSLSVLRMIGKFKNATLSTDLAFLWAGSGSYESCESSNDNNFRRILIVPRAFFPDDPNRKKYGFYVRALAALTEHLSSNYRLTFVTTARDEAGGEDDMQAVFDVLRLVQRREGLRIIKDDLDPLLLIKMFAQNDLIIGTRLHSVIFAIIAEKPFIAISYFGPKMSIVEDLGLSELIVDINNIDENMLISKVSRILDNLEWWNSEVKKAKQKAYEIAFKDSSLRKALDILT